MPPLGVLIHQKAGIKRSFNEMCKLNHRHMGFLSVQRFPVAFRSPSSDPLETDQKNLLLSDTPFKTTSLTQENSLRQALLSAEGNEAKVSAIDLTNRLVSALNIRVLEAKQKEVEKTAFYNATMELFNQAKTAFDPTDYAAAVNNQITSSPALSNGLLSEFKEDEVKKYVKKLVSEKKRVIHNIHDEYILADSFEKILHYWHTDLTAAIEKSKTNSKLTKTNPYICLLPAKLISNIVLNKVVHYLKTAPSGVPTVKICESIGFALKKYAGMFHTCELDKMTYKEFDLFFKFHLDQKVDKYVLEKQTELLFKMNDIKTNDEWDDLDVIRVGAVLLELFKDSTAINIMRNPNSIVGSKLHSLILEDKGIIREQVIELTHINKGPSLMQGIIRGNVHLVSFLLKDNVINVEEPALNAMLCPPRKWTNPFNGGFIYQKNRLVKADRGSEQIKALKTMTDKTIYDAVNYLGDIPWTINKRIYNLAKFVIENDLALGGMVGKLSVQKLPEKPNYNYEANAKNPIPLKDRVDYIEHRKKLSEYFLEVDRLSRESDSQNSKYMDAKLKLRKATELVDAEQFWFPFFYDFRGRVYPLPPHLNHLQSDLSRALLVFKEKRPLRESGIRWLKIHIANLFGFDKASFEDRVAWVDDKLAKGLVQDSAENPLDPSNPAIKKWWNTAEDPWQALGAMMELNDALKSPDPAKFLSCISVHQDGSCNGLQHYAALGRDLFGAKQVNLVNSEKPSDVYSEVCRRVNAYVGNESKKYIAKLGIAGVEETWKVDLKKNINEDTVAKLYNTGQTEEASALQEEYLSFLLKNKITRKVVKQTVMTSVYGVTFIGAKEQIKRQLEDLNEKLAEKYGKSPDYASLIKSDPNQDYIIMTDNEIDKAAKFLARVTLDAIGDTFRSAKDIKDWLKKVAKLTVSLNENVKWISPVGLPVEQVYNDSEVKIIRTGLQQISYNVFNSKNASMSKSQQQTAFPPNFIHSLDASHMIFTCLRCKEENILFTAVHDSYWTHAGEVDKMNVILREEFVKMHKKDLLGILKEQFCSRFPQLADQLEDPPKQNDFDLDLVKESQYFFN